MFTRPHLLLLAAALTPGCASSSLADHDDLAFESAGEVIDGEFVISAQLNARELEELGLSLLDYDDLLGAGLYFAEEDVSRSAISRALQNHRASSGILVEPNRPARRYSVNDPYRSFQWNFDLLDMESAWSVSTGSGVTVAVLDTGLYMGGSDTPINVVGGYDFIEGDSTPNDEEGHGSHVAGTIAQATNNGTGVAGVAHDANLMPVRVLGGNGSGSTYGIAQGIIWAADNGAEVMNMSLGSAYPSTVQQDALEYADDLGVVLIAATGNEGRGSISYPAAYPEVIAVGAVGADKQVTSYSNRGTGIDIVAPGGDTYVDKTGDGYADGILQETPDGFIFLDGTSMATPHVAGAAALLIAAGAEPAEVRSLLNSTAEDVGSSGWDTASGYGFLDVNAALEAIGTHTGTPDSDSGTPVAGPDTTAPEVSGLSTDRQGNKLTIAWTTDEPATSEIEFDGYGVYGDTTLVTDHQARFTINPNGEYTFAVVSRDAAGNEAFDGWWVTN